VSFHDRTAQKLVKLACFKGFVWIVWLWFIGNRNMWHCRVSFLKQGCVWM